jgi:hypothetical protein
MLAVIVAQLNATATSRGNIVFRMLGSFGLSSRTTRKSKTAGIVPNLRGCAAKWISLDFLGALANGSQAG